MAKLVATPQLNMKAQLEISEAEARFLDALFGYGGEALVQAVRKELGTHYIARWEKEGVQFVDQMRPMLAGILGQFDAARKVFSPETDRG